MSAKARLFEIKDVAIENCTTAQLYISNNRKHNSICKKIFLCWSCHDLVMSFEIEELQKRHRKKLC